MIGQDSLGDEIRQVPFGRTYRSIGNALFDFEQEVGYMHDDGFVFFCHFEDWLKIPENQKLFNELKLGSLFFLESFKLQKITLKENMTEQEKEWERIWPLAGREEVIEFLFLVIEEKAKNCQHAIKAKITLNKERMTSEKCNGAVPGDSGYP